jgi:DNA-binding transcriptional MerR regulator
MRPLMTDVEDRPLVSQDDERRGQKSADAYRTISEVADELKLPQHVLRFWESKFKQIMPMKRAGGRRFYRPQDIELIKRIHYLLYTQGYTIKGVQKAADQGPPAGAIRAQHDRDNGQHRCQRSIAACRAADYHPCKYTSSRHYRLNRQARS